MERLSSGAVNSLNFFTDMFTPKPAPAAVIPAPISAGPGVSPITKDTPDVAAARDKTLAAAAAAKGRASTLLTGVAGDTSQANTRRTTLLGRGG